MPSTQTLALATAAALMAAIVILVTVVLPAEYGIDPLGTGRRLGIKRNALVVAPRPAPGEGDAVTMIPVQDGPLANYPGEFRVDSRELVLGPYEFIEFKYRLEKGATMVFSWKASDDVIHDFHGDTDGATKDEPQSYDQQPRRSADGSFAAPFAGIHGWYWENPGGNPITIKLTAAGFFTSAHEFHIDRSRRERQLGSLDRVPLTSAGKESIK